MKILADTPRRILVTLAAASCVVMALFGSGITGEPVGQSSGGSLTDDATMIAPAGPAFSIWSVIYLGLLAYTVWQWRSSSERTRQASPWAAFSLALNAAWLLVVQLQWIWASVVVIIALLGVLLMLVRVLVAEPAQNWLERIVVDGTFGIYLGWVSVATCANIAAAATDSGLKPGSPVEDVLAVVVLAVVALVALLVGLRLPLRWPIVIAMSWGLAWIVIGRVTGEPPSVAAAVTAALAAVIGLAAAAVGQLRGRGMPRRGAGSASPAPAR